MERERSRTGAMLLVAGVSLLLAGPALAANLVGQWDFDSGLNATVGTAMDYFDGPGGATQTNTAFKKTSGFNLPSVVPTDAAGNPTGAAVDAGVMSFPAAAQTMGYVVTHGIAANGGGSYVNQYTLVMDLLWPQASQGTWRGLFQTNTTNSNDGDFFINPDNGIGISGQYHGTILAETWQRVAVSFDLTTSTMNKFVNGVLVNSQTLSQGVDGRWALDPTFLLFTDEDGETAAGFVDKVMLYDGALSAKEVESLGGLANGPVIPEPATLGLIALGGMALLRRRSR